MKWNEIASSEKYQQLSPESQQAAKDKYFNMYVVPKAPQAQLESIKTRFYERTSAFDAPAPTAQNDNGFIENVGRGALERVGDLAGGLLKSTANLGQTLEEKGLNLGGVVFDGGLPSYSPPSEWSERRKQGIRDVGKEFGESLENVDLGYEDRHNPESIKAKFKESDYSGTASEAVKFGVSSTLKSIPDMVSVVYALPAYVLSRSQEIGDTRAKNKGKPEAGTEEILEAAPFALGSALLERILPKGILDDLGAANVTKFGEGALKEIAKKVGAGAAKEGATEAVQEGLIEYVGETLGTDKAMQFTEALERGAWGALGGAIGGGALSGAAQTVKSAIPQRNTPEQDLDVAEPGSTPGEFNPGERMSELLGLPKPATRVPPVDESQIAKVGNANTGMDSPVPWSTQAQQDLTAVEQTNDSVPTPVEEEFDIAKEIARLEALVVQDQKQREIDAAYQSQEQSTEVDPVRQAIDLAAPPSLKYLAGKVRGKTDKLQEKLIAQKPAPANTAIADALAKAKQPEAIPNEPVRDDSIDSTAQVPEVKPDQQAARQGIMVDSKVSQPERDNTAGTPVADSAETLPDADIATDEQPALETENVVNAEKSKAATESVKTPEKSIEIDVAANEAASSPMNDLPEPTEAQKEKGNYKKGHVKVQGLDISIENPKGSKRSGTDDKGNKWENELAHHYGYIKRTEGADGDHVDVFVGENPDSKFIYVVDQVNKDGTFDEHKVMMGFPNQKKAIDGYRANHTKGWKVGPVTKMTTDEFKDWLKGDTSKPLKLKPQTPKAAAETPRAKPPEVEPKAEKPTPPPEVKADPEPPAPTKPEPEIKEKGAVLADKADQKIDDFGEKLEGARKFTHSFRETLADDVDVKALPLSKSFPRPDYEKLAETVDKKTLAFIAALRAEIRTKPRQSYKVARWAEGVEAARSFARDLLDGKYDYKTLAERMRSYTKVGYVKPSAEVFELADEIPPALIEELGKYRIDEAHYITYRGEKDVNKFVVSTANQARGRRENAFDTKEQALAYIKSQVMAANTDSKAAPIKFDIWKYRGSDVYSVGKKLTGAKYILLKEFPTIVEARDYINTHNAELAELLKKKKAVSNHRRVEQNERIGKDYRRGESVTPELFTNTFGFRGVQFGNYVENDRRQQDLNNTYDGLMDLAGVLGIPPQALSLNGQLGLAFGARGRGGASAHYEPNEVVINLTKTAGPGSLAHEWFHAVDHYFHKMDLSETEKASASLHNDPTYGFMSKRKRRTWTNDNFPVRDEVYEAFRNLRETINDSGLYKRSIRLDGRRTKDYWSTMHEMAARSFERYVIDKLAEQGYESDYLATILDQPTWDFSEEVMGNPSRAEKSTYPYPTDAEAKDFLKTFDNLFDTLETQETDQGTMLYSRGATAKGMPVNEVKNIIQEFFEKYPAAAKGTNVRVSRSLGEAFGPNRDRERTDDVKAGYTPSTGELLLIASRMDNKRDVIHTLQHELIVHKGLGVFGPETEKQLIDTIVENAPQSRSLKSLWAEIQKDYEGDSPQVQAEELIARLAERDLTKFDRFLNKIMMAIKKALASIGFISSESIPREKLIENIYRIAEAMKQNLNVRQRDVDGTFAARNSNSFQVPAERIADAFIRVWADKMRPLLKTQRTIEQTDGELEDDVNAYRAEEAFYGKTEEDLRKLRETYLEPLAKKMAEYNIPREELDMFLWARHAEERNKQIAKINPDMPDGGSGMSTAQARNILSMARAEGRFNRLDELSQYVYDMLKHQRDLKRNLTTEDEIDAWENAYEHYVPLKGHADDESGGAYPKIGKGFDIRGKETLRALGRRTKPESPTLHAVKDTTETVVRHRKNEVGNVFLGLVERYPNPDYWQVFSTDDPEFERKLLKSGGKETVGEGRVINKNNYFITKRDGQEYYIKLQDERLMRAMKNMGPEPMNKVLQILGMASRFLSSMNTSYNPEFMITNASRDIQTAVLNLLAEQDLHDGKVKGKKLATKMVKGVPRAIRAIHASMYDKALTGDNAEWQRYFEMFREDGAKTGWFDMKDVDGQAADLENMINEASQTTKGKLLRAKRAIGELVEHANSAIENGVRLSVYKAAIESGVSRKKAASLAKNLTVNFNRKGEIGATLNAMYMFANASIQGTLVFARAMGTLKADDQGNKKLNTAQKAAVGLSIAAFGLALLNREMAGEDDDGENWYDKVPDYVKERNIVLMKSLFGGPEGEFYKIPLPYGYNIFHVLGTEAESAISGDGIGGAAGNVARAALGAFSPLGIAESDSFAGAFTRTVAPTVLSPFADLAANENFFGANIYRENMPFGIPKPESSLGKKNTGEHWKAISKWLNEVTGGSEYRPGLIDVNPDKLKYLMNFAVGSAGAFYDRSVTAAGKAITGEELEDKDTPFLRNVTGEVSHWEDISTFYDRKTKAEQYFQEWKELRGPEKLEFRKKHSEIIKVARDADRTADMLKNIRERSDRIQSSKVLTDKEKREKQEALDKRRDEVVDKFNAQYPEGY